MKKFAPDVAILAVLVVTLVAAVVWNPPAKPARKAATAEAGPAATGASGSFALRDVRVFDGERVIERANVIVREGRIETVAADASIDAGVTVVEGKGRTLLPGLIDAHVHAWGDAQRDALRFGVTTEIDMHGDTTRLPALKAQRESLQATANADLWAAGSAVTAPGGHGTQFGMPVPTLAADGDAAAFVGARLAEGADFIKIIVEDLGVYSGAPKWPTLSVDQVGAVVAATHAAKRIAVVHVSRQSDALAAITRGADGLAHVFVDSVADDTLIAAMKAHDAFIVPTLSVTAANAGQGDGASLAGDAALKPFLGATQLGTLRARFEALSRNPAWRDNAFASVRALHAAGVSVLAGTDAGNPGTAHGASLHGELELLVRAGLTPAQALAAATSRPAQRFGMADRGRIAAGLRADLVLVEGDPLADITRTRSIVGVWKNGHAVVRDAAIVAEVGAPSAHAATLLSTFDDGTLAVASGGSWASTSDTMMGGASETAQQLVDGGAGNSRGALEVSGEIRPGFIEPWAGAMLFVDATPMQARDYSTRRELVFQLRGDGREVRVMLFSGPSEQAMPAMRTVVAPREWSEVRLPLSDFAGADTAQLRAIAFTAGNPPGTFRFRIDGVELR